jgi:hypothetical protein
MIDCPNLGISTEWSCLAALPDVTAEIPLQGRSIGVQVFAQDHSRGESDGWALVIEVAN